MLILLISFIFLYPKILTFEQNESENIHCYYKFQICVIWNLYMVSFFIEQ